MSGYLSTPYNGETNGLIDAKAYHEEFSSKIDYTRVIDWTDSRLAKIVRLRLLSDPGYPAWDVSYCHGVLKDGTPVRVQLPFDQLPKRKINETIIAHAKRDKVFAKGLNIFNAISTLI